MKSHYNLTTSPIVKRFKFNSRCQGESKSVATYVAELRKIVEHSQFGCVLNDMLRDRLLYGIRHKGIQRKLVAEQSLTFDKAITTALAAEAANKDSLRLTTRDKEQTTPDITPPVTIVNKVEPQKPQRSNHNKSPLAA